MALSGIYTALGVGQGLGNSSESYAQGQSQGMNMANALMQRQMMIEQIKKSQELAALGNELYDARSSVFNSPSTTPTTPTPIQPNAGLGAPITPTPKQTTTPATQPPATQPVASGMNQPSTVPAGVPLPDEDKYLVEPTSAMAGSSRKQDPASGFKTYLTDYGNVKRNNFGNVWWGGSTKEFAIGPDPEATGALKGIALFTDPLISEKAMHSVWSSDWYNEAPISQTIRKKYTPENAEGNTPESVTNYIGYLKEKTGLDLDNLKYNDLSAEQQAILRAAQGDWEHATGGKYLKQTLNAIQSKSSPSTGKGSATKPIDLYSSFNPLETLNYNPSNIVIPPELRKNLNNPIINEPKQIPETTTVPPTTAPTPPSATVPPMTALSAPVVSPDPTSTPVPETTTAQPMAALSAPATKPMDIYAPFNPLETLKYNPSSAVPSPEVINSLNNPKFRDANLGTFTYDHSVTGFISMVSPDGERVVLKEGTTPETATPEQLEWFKKHTDHGHPPFIEYSKQFEKPKTETSTPDTTAKPSEPVTQTQPSTSSQPVETTQPTAPTEPVAETQPIAKPSQSGYSKNLVEYRNKVIAYQRKAMELYALTRDPQYGAMAKQAEEQLLSAFQNVATKSFLSGDSQGLKEAFSAMYGGEGPEIKIEKLSDGTYGASLYKGNDKVMELHASQIYNIGNPAVLAEAEQAYALKLGAIQMNNRAKAQQIEMKQRGTELSKALAVGTNPATGAKVALNNDDDIADWINAYGRASITINQQAAAAAARAESLRSKNSLWRSMDGQPVSETTAKEILQVFQEINKNPSAYTINGKPYTMSELISLIQKRFGIVFQGKIPDQGTITEMTFDENTGNIVTRKTAIN